MKNFTIVTILISLIIPFAGCANDKILTYEDIIAKTYDLPGLAKLPPKDEKGALASSYDRKSKYDTKAGSYVKWHSNGDFKGFVRREGEYLVLADIKGPGVIWRTWSASVGEGRVKMYLDGKLAVDLPWKEYFTGTIPPFNRKGLVYTAAKGKNNYTPISFQKSCKIITKITDEQADKFTFKNGSGVYGKFFHFNYTQFPSNTIVETFKMKLSPAENKALDKASEIMTIGLGENPITYKNTKKKILSWVIPAGKSKSFVVNGKQAITALKIQIPKHNNYNKLLRLLTLSINWDNQKSPAVWSPLGDFFGTAPGINQYKSLVMGMTKLNNQHSIFNKKCSSDKIPLNPPLKKGDYKNQSTNEITCVSRMFKHKVQSTNVFEFYSYWYMPFEKKANITIKNETDRTQEIQLIVQHSPLKFSFDNFGYFHAKWHRDLKFPMNISNEWLLVDTIGRGRFVGNSLNVWNPGGRWWGEGDEKFFVDGEKFPSTFGTGSEDYFGFAWCRARFFEKAYHSQPINHGNKGHISVNRWHISDNIPFQKSFMASMEKCFKNSRPTLYDGTVYWYLSKNGIDNIKPTPLKDRSGYYAPFKLFRIPGVIEAEKLPVTTSKGILTTLYLPDVGWSACEQFELLDGPIGTVIDLKVNQPKNAEKNLIVRVTKAEDYANLQFYFNDKKVGGVIDCYRPRLKLCEINLGKVKIKKGENSIKIKIVGVSSKNVKRNVVGIDYFKFE